MNAVIVDIRGKYAAALDESGRVVRIPNANYELGQTLELHEVKTHRPARVLRRIGSMAAAVALVLTIGTGTAYALPYGTVTLEGDSSLSYTINCFDYVLDVQAVNEEGEALLAGMDARQLRHRPIESAVAATMEHMEEEDVPQQAKDGFRISAETRSERHSERLRQELEPLIERMPPAPPEGESAPPTGDAAGMRDAPPMEPEGVPGQNAQSPNAPKSAEMTPPDTDDTPEGTGTEGMMPQDREHTPAFRPDDGGAPPDIPGASAEQGQAPPPPMEAQGDRPGPYRSGSTWSFLSGSIRRSSSSRMLFPPSSYAI